MTFERALLLIKEGSITGAFGVWGGEIRWDLPDPRTSNEVRRAAEQAYKNNTTTFTHDGVQYTLEHVDCME